MSVVQVHHVEELLQRELTGQEAIAAQHVINAVEADLRGRLNRPLEVEAFTETHRLPWNFQGVVFLTNAPVVSVESVTIDGNALVANQSYGWNRFALVGLSYFGGGYGTALVVEYHAGLTAASIPAMRAKMIEVAARNVQRIVIDRAIGVAGVQIEGYSATYSGAIDLPVNWTDAEIKPLKRYYRRT